jgi:hypothetical protein
MRTRKPPFGKPIVAKAVNSLVQAVDEASRRCHRCPVRHRCQAKKVLLAVLSDRDLLAFAAQDAHR